MILHADVSQHIWLEPMLDSDTMAVCLLLCWCFTALQSLFMSFLTYPHCSWASLLGSLPELSVHSFVSNWQLPFLSGRERIVVEIFHDQTPRNNVVGREDRTRDRHAHPVELPCPACLLVYLSDILIKN